MKYLGLFLTDTHLSDSTIEINKSIFNQAIEICLKNNIKHVFHAGDILQDRKLRQSLATLNTLNDILLLFSENDIQLHAIPGNHSKISYSSELSWLDTFRYYPNFHLYSTTDYFDLENYCIHFVPFFDENVNYIEYLQLAIENIDVSKTNILLTHIGITGVRNNDQTEVKNDLPIEMFLKFDQVLSGHYHEKQSLQNGKILYFGSAFQANFGEGLDKGFTLLKENGELEFIPSIFPKYLTVQIDLDKQTKKQYDPILNASIEHAKTSKDRFRFEFTGEANKLKTIDKGQYEKLGIDVSIKNKEVEIKEVEKYQQVKVLSNSEIKESFKEFCIQEELDYETGIKYLNQKL